MKYAEEIGRSRSGNSQVAYNTQGYPSTGSGSFRDSAPGNYGTDGRAFTGGIHHAARRPWGSKRDPSSQGRISIKQRAYTIAVSASLCAVGVGLTLMEVFSK